MTFQITMTFLQQVAALQRIILKESQISKKSESQSNFFSTTENHLYPQVLLERNHRQITKGYRLLHLILQITIIQYIVHIQDVQKFIWLQNVLQSFKIKYYSSVWTKQGFQPFFKETEPKYFIFCPCTKAYGLRNRSLTIFRR